MPASSRILEATRQRPEACQPTSEYSKSRPAARRTACQLQNTRNHLSASCRQGGQLQNTQNHSPAFYKQGVSFRILIIIRQRAAGMPADSSRLLEISRQYPAGMPAARRHACQLQNNRNHSPASCRRAFKPASSRILEITHQRPAGMPASCRHACQLQNARRLYAPSVFGMFYVPGMCSASFGHVSEMH